MELGSRTRRELKTVRGRPSPSLPRNPHLLRKSTRPSLDSSHSPSLFRTNRVNVIHYLERAASSGPISLPPCPPVDKSRLQGSVRAHLCQRLCFTRSAQADLPSCFERPRPFSGDPMALTISHQKLREAYESDVNRSETDPAKYQERVTMAREIGDVLQRNVVQGVKRETENTYGESQVVRAHRFRCSLRRPPPSRPGVRSLRR